MAPPLKNILQTTFPRGSTSVTRCGEILPFGLLFEGLGDFFLEKVAEKNGDILGYFLIWSKSSIFTLISSFKTCFDVDILNFIISFVVDVLDFQIGFDVDILAFFCSAIFLATFCQISANFFSNCLVTLIIMCEAFMYSQKSWKNKIENKQQYNHIRIKRCRI